MFNQPVLVLEKNCLECSCVYSAIDLDKMSDVTYTASLCPRIFVWLSLSPDGTKPLLESLGIKSDKAPVLRLSDGTELIKLYEIMAELKRNGLLK